jgi:hypothetical protein
VFKCSFISRTGENKIPHLISNQVLEVFLENSWYSANEKKPYNTVTINSAAEQYPYRYTCLS